MKTICRFSSTDIGAHTFAAPALVPGCGSSGSQLQRGAPVRASKARTRPEGAAARPLSLIAEPTITTSPTTTGADEIWNSPGQTSAPGSISTCPFFPKPTQARPVRASRAISRASVVALRMRHAQGATLATDASRHCATPRQL